MHTSQLEPLQQEVFLKVKDAAEAYHEQAQCRNTSFDFQTWIAFAKLLSEMESFIGDEVKAKDRDQLLKAYCGVSRSTARRQLQIFDNIHLIEDASLYSSWSQLYEATKEAINKTEQ